LRRHSLPGIKKICDPRPALRAALALTVAVAGIRDLQAIPLRVMAKTGGKTPSAVGAAVVVAGRFGPYGVRAFAAREWQFQLCSQPFRSDWACRRGTPFGRPRGQRRSGYKNDGDCVAHHSFRLRIAQ
jgi:hypothetical protein